MPFQRTTHLGVSCRKYGILSTTVVIAVESNRLQVVIGWPIGLHNLDMSALVQTLLTEKDLSLINTAEGGLRRLRYDSRFSRSSLISTLQKNTVLHSGNPFYLMSLSSGMHYYFDKRFNRF